MCADNVGAATGLGFLVVVGLAAAAVVGFGLGMSMVKTGKVVAGTVMAVLCLGAAAYGMWAAGWFA
jgi:hypothetical protein